MCMPPRITQSLEPVHLIWCCRWCITLCTCSNPTNGFGISLPIQFLMVYAFTAHNMCVHSISVVAVTTHGQNWSIFLIHFLTLSSLSTPTFLSLCLPPRFVQTLCAGHEINKCRTEFATKTKNGSTRFTHIILCCCPLSNIDIKWMRRRIRKQAGTTFDASFNMTFQRKD